LDWELYVRNLTHSRVTVARALFGSSETGATPRISRNNDGIYVSMLLGGAAPVILALIAIAAYHAKAYGGSWALAIAGSLLLWVYALLKTVSTLQTTRRISARIIDAAPPDQAAPAGLAARLQNQ
jgi:ABC-type transport system involved in Fe-S cluster assembly fused permease/ATPase subunit